jgi:hypothetical protein
MNALDQEHPKDQQKLCVLPVAELVKLLLIRVLLVSGEHALLAKEAGLKLKNPANHAKEVEGLKPQQK